MQNDLAQSLLAQVRLLLAPRQGGAGFEGSRYRLGGATSAAPRSYALLAGQSHTIDVAAGEGLRVVRGRVRVLRAPRWLGECLVRAELALRSGDLHRSVERETLVVVAMEATEVSVGAMG